MFSLFRGCLSVQTSVCSTNRQKEDSVLPPLQHSKFSASASARLLACPGSYELSIKADDGSRRSTVFSAQGTLAHAICEVCIQTGKDVSEFIGEKRSADGYDFTLDEEFAEHAQVYVDYIRGLRAVGFIVMLEQQVDPSVQFKEAVDVNLFGTADCVAYNPDTRELVIADLKFGAGVPVNVNANSQLLYYGAGACHFPKIEEYCKSANVIFNGVEDVTLTIIQPRAYHPDGPIRRYNTTPADVKAWARDVLHAGVIKALSDNGQTLDAGTWCRFCPVLAHCDKPAELSLATARSAFQNAPVQNIPPIEAPDAELPAAHIADDKLADLLDKVAIIEPWLKALKDLGHERLTAGSTLDGWKLVAKRAQRKWAGDDYEMAQALTSAGLTPNEFETTKLLTPAQVEKKVGKKEYNDAVAPHVVKNSTGTTIAASGDPRKRIEQRLAKDAFTTAEKLSTLRT